ncbi:hypothetical protein [Gluconobacter wancherniae]|uniref:hypothetical protein n=1 Tax=Gluconobacter wancherniae TaxID=1307955 RepID=UPI001B8AE147|nr:hypothetical protein [Gluconobacter wancherniae]MBS1089814.1 hypothetical protein [Gluconobacter wancherniae]
MFQELVALLALADDLYNHNQRQETLTVIDNIYALHDLNPFHYTYLQAQQMIANHNSLEDGGIEEPLIDVLGS